MARRLDKILVVDVEATCWDKQPPEGEVSEIIEIGVAVLDTFTLSISDTWDVFVRPRMSAISPFCTALTTITPEQVAQTGIPLADACAHLREILLSEDRLWVSWGDYDRNMFQAQCQRDDVRYPFGTTHLNLKNMWAIAHGQPSEDGVAKALGIAGMVFEGTPYRGGDDAANTARLLARLLARL